MSSQYKGVGLRRDNNKWRGSFRDNYSQEKQAGCHPTELGAALSREIMIVKQIEDLEKDEANGDTVAKLRIKRNFTFGLSELLRLRQLEPPQLQPPGNQSEGSADDDTVLTKRMRILGAAEDNRWPPWLKCLLGEQQFFLQCKMHTDSEKPKRLSECKFYCLDCMNGSLCSICLSSPCSVCLCSHKEHRKIQIWKSSNQEAVEVIEIQNFLDISSVQTYIHNYRKIIYLNESPQSRQGKGKGVVTNTCKVCEFSIHDPFCFCSLGCKIVGTTERIPEDTVESPEFVPTENSRSVTTLKPYGSLTSMIFETLEAVNRENDIHGSSSLYSGSSKSSSKVDSTFNDLPPSSEKRRLSETPPSPFTLELDLALKRFKSKIEAWERGRSYQIRTSAAKAIKKEIATVKSQIAADTLILNGLKESKIKSFERRYEELEGQFNAIHARFKDEFNPYLQDCRSFADNLDAHELEELRNIKVKQGVSHRQLLLDTEKLIKQQLSDAERRITELVSAKMNQLKCKVAEVFDPREDDSASGSKLQPLSDSNELGLESAFSGLALDLERLKSKVKSSASAQIPTSAEIQQQLQTVKNKIQADMSELNVIAESKIERLNMKYEELQGQLNGIYARFKDEVNRHFQVCRSFVEDLDALHMELKVTVEKQGVSHRKSLLEAEKLIEKQLSDAERRLAELEKVKKIRLKREVAKWFPADT